MDNSSLVCFLGDAGSGEGGVVLEMKEVTVCSDMCLLVPSI